MEFRGWFVNYFIRCLMLIACSALNISDQNVVSTTPKSAATAPSLTLASASMPSSNTSTTVNLTSTSSPLTASTKSRASSLKPLPESTTHTPGTTTEIDHFDRSHPVNVTGYGSTAYTMTIIWAISLENYTDLNGFIIHYYKYRDRNNPKKHTVITVPKEARTTNITKVMPGTRYSMFVVANYTTGHQPRSYVFTRTTMGYGQDNSCNCSRTGSNQSMSCHPVSGQCPCINKHTTGRTCDQCNKGYIWHSTLACVLCPECPKPRGLGTCHTDERGVFRCDCVGFFGGDKCESCAENYFMSGDTCKPCGCYNNTDPVQRRSCDQKTGVCRNCLFNTTGKYCHKCLPDYVGDPIIAKNCTHRDHIAKPQSARSYSPVYQFFHDHLGVIVGVLVSVLALMTVIAVVSIYKRWLRWRRRPLQFWTVQLKEDHERVSFSSDHPYQHVDASLLSDDVQFRIPDDTVYEDEERSHKSKSRMRAGDGSTPYQSLN